MSPLPYVCSFLFPYYIVSLYSSDMLTYLSEDRMMILTFN